jgi:hypothetical protein
MALQRRSAVTGEPAGRINRLFADILQDCARFLRSRHLTDIACDIGQGYLFGKPMPEQDMLRVVIEARADKASSVDPGTRAPAA